MTDINLEFDALKVKCVAFSGSDPLPGTNVTKFKVEQANMSLMAVCKVELVNSIVT